MATSVEGLGNTEETEPSTQSVQSICSLTRHTPTTANDSVQMSSSGGQSSPYTDFLQLFDDRHNGATSSNGTTRAEIHQLSTAPLFSTPIHQRVHEDLGLEAAEKKPYQQYGLLGRMITTSPQALPESPSQKSTEDSLVFTNVAEPWSAFICGSQGSGKSHTLSCLLENNLLPNPRIGSLQIPLTSMVFHYDKFSNFNSGQVCETAYLCSSGVPVRVLVAPTSLSRMVQQYRNLPGLSSESSKPKVIPLFFGQEQLSVDVMMTLMAVHDTGTSPPLYISAIRGVLRNIALENQNRQGFDYIDFRRRLAELPLTEAQTGPLNLRLELLESLLLEVEQTAEAAQACQEIWNFDPGTLTIVDLSDQFVNETDACALFSICLKLFMDGWQLNPRIIALDEAHKFLTTSSEATKLTTDLVAIIRQQRHLSSRVVIATQEPTVSGSLLDLCNVSIIHRFNSPQWYNTIQQHLAGANSDVQQELFNEIVKLSTGQALIFSPTSVLSLESSKPKPLENSSVKILVRNRISADGGRSVQSSHHFAARNGNVQSPTALPQFQRFDGFKAPKPGSLAKGKAKAVQSGNVSSYLSGTTANNTSAIGLTAINVTTNSAGSISKATFDKDSLGTQSGTTSSSSGVGSSGKQIFDGTTNTGSRSAALPLLKVGQASSSSSKVKRNSSSRIAVAANAKRGLQNLIITEDDLERRFSAAIAEEFGDTPPNNPCSLISSLPQVVSGEYGLPGRFLLDHSFKQGCRDKDAKAMMKRIIREYYDEKGVPMKRRATNCPWLRD